MNMTNDSQQPNPLQRVVRKYEERFCSKWKPNGVFYARTDINQKRFGLLLRGDLEPTVSEVKSLSSFFGVEANEFLN